MPEAQRGIFVTCNNAFLSPKFQIFFYCKPFSRNSVYVPECTIHNSRFFPPRNGVVTPGYPFQHILDPLLYVIL